MGVRVCTVCIAEKGDFFMHHLLNCVFLHAVFFTVEELAHEIAHAMSAISAIYDFNRREKEKEKNSNFHARSLRVLYGCSIGLHSFICVS
jgi:hypothetical protein